MEGSRSPRVWMIPAPSWYILFTGHWKNHRSRLCDVATAENKMRATNCLILCFFPTNQGSTYHHSYIYIYPLDNPGSWQKSALRRMRSGSSSLYSTFMHTYMHGLLHWDPWWLTCIFIFNNVYVYRPNKSMIHAVYSKVQLFDPSGVPLQAETLSSLVLLHVLNLKIHNQDPIPPCKVLHAI